MFELGIENEENGNLYEAVQFYKKAFQLVPDIELRVAQQHSFIPGWSIIIYILYAFEAAASFNTYVSRLYDIVGLLC